MNIFLPIETIARELDYRLFLAGYFARRHRRIFVGHSPAIDRIAAESDGGVYVGKHNFYRLPSGKLIYHDAKAAGVVVLHHAEEGAVFFGREDAWDAELGRVLDPHELGPEDYVCTWGDYQRAYYSRSNPACAVNVVTVGHPRFDLCGTKYRDIYADAVRDIRAKYGEFVLINSNFANTPTGVRGIFSRYMGYDPAHDAARERYVASWARTARAFPSFVELVHKLSIQRKDINFVFRPHPSDEVSVYESAFAGVPNIFVVREGAVGPWILASRLLIHDGSTSGIEAHLFDRPVVNYCREQNVDTEIYLPKVVGTTCHDEGHAIETVLGILESNQPGAISVDIPPRALSLFHNFRNEAFPLLLDTMEQAERQVQRRRASRLGMTRIRAVEMAAATVEGVKQLLRPLSPSRYRTSREIRALFPGFERKLLGRKLAIVRRLTGNPIELTFHSRKLIEITSPRT